MPGLAQTRPAERLLLDGSLLPTGQRAGQEGQDLYNGKRHQAGMNVQVISDRWGRLVEVSDPTPGARHDARSFVVCGLGRALADRSVLADLGFLGCGVQTPVRKPPGGELCELEKANNRAMPVLVRRWSGPLRCSSSGELWAVVSRAAGAVPQGDPDGGGVGKVPNLRKPIVNNAPRVPGAGEV
jgi:hypothetical protein